MLSKTNGYKNFYKMDSDKKYAFTALDLFCGAGGLTVGLKQAGFTVLAGIEINPLAAETYSLNHKDHFLFQNDIRKLSPYEVMVNLNIKPGELDLLAGCPPCQGFSSHRTRNKTISLDDDRNDLIFEFVKYIEAFLPKTIMMENVPALAKDDRIKKAMNKLERIGYYIDENSIQIKDAADYGVPQRRKRLIFKASRYGKIENPKINSRKITVKDAIGNLAEAGKSGDWLHDYPEARTEKTKKIISLIPKNGGSRSDLPIEYWLPCHKKNPGGYKDVYGRMSWNDVAPTITGGCSNPSKGRFLHPEFNRTITLREAALLQTFPSKYKFSRKASKDNIALMIGNALPPEFIKRQAVEFRKHLEKIKGNKNGRF